MADDPWGVVPEEDDQEFLNIFDYIDLDTLDCPSDVPMLNSGNNDDMSSNGGGDGPNISLADPPSQFFVESENTMSPSDLPRQICESGDNNIALSGLPSQIFKYGVGGVSAPDIPSTQSLETGDNSVSQADLPWQLFESQGSTISLGHQASKFYGAQGSAPSSLDDHPSQIVREVGEPSFNPLAEIFEKRSAIEDQASQIFPAPYSSSQFFISQGSNTSLKDFPTLLYEAGGSALNSSDDHPSQNSREKAESSFNPLAEIFGEKKNAILLGDRYRPSKMSLLSDHSSQAFGSLGTNISLADHPSQLHGAAMNVSNLPNNHSLPIFRVGGKSTQSSPNPLPEIFGHRKSTILPEDHQSLDDYPQHIFRPRGELSLDRIRSRNNNPEGFRNNSKLPLLPMKQLSRRPSLSSCNDCHVLMEIVHCNYNCFIRVEIHSKLGVICHAIEERRPNIFHSYSAYCREPTYERFDFHSNSLKEVMHFLTQYCKKRKAEGYVRQADPEQTMEENEWEDVLSLFPEGAEDLIPEEDLDTDGFGPLNSNEMDHQHADTASSWKGKGRPVQLPMLSPEQIMRAGRIRLEDIRAYFHLTSEEASEQLGFPLPYFRRLCLKFGVVKWPGRKIRTISKEITNLKPLLYSHQKSTRDYAKARIKALDKEMARLLRYS